MLRSKLPLFVLFSILVGCLPPAPTYEIQLPERHLDLPNGMHVIVLPDESSDMVEVDVRYNVGSKEDPPGKAGLAHLVEHMMFMQKPVDEKGVVIAGQPSVWVMIQRIAVFFNAYTSHDSTHYMMLARKESLEDLIKIETFRLHMQCTSISEEEFLREREVVRNEIRLRSGSPEALIRERIQKAVFPKTHPYHESVGGDDLQLTNITLQDACDFMKKYYTPDRATVIIAGNVNEDTARDLVAKWLPLPKRTPVALNPVPAFAIKKARHDMEADVEQTSVHVVWQMPAKYSKDDAVADFLFAAFGRIQFEALEYGYATRIQPFLLGGDETPLIGIAAYLKNDDKVDVAIESIQRLAKRTYQGFDSSDDLEVTRQWAMADLVLGLENLTGRTQSFGDYAQFDEERKFFRGAIERVQAMNGKDVRRVLKRALDPKRAVVVVIRPKKGVGLAKKSKTVYKADPHANRDSTGVDPKEAKQALPVPSKASHVSSARHFTLKNGMRVAFTKTTGLPIVNVSLMFDVGSAHEPPNKAGLANIAANLQPGANITSFDEYSTQLAELTAIGRLRKSGARFGGRATSDDTRFNAHGLNIYLDDMLIGIEALIRAGDYRQESIERTASRYRTTMRRKSVLKRANFSRKLAEAIYGPDHPYAATGRPTLKSIGNIDRAAALAFKKKHYTAANATLIIAGNFDDVLAEKLVRKYYGGWSAGRKDKSVAAEALARTAPIYLAGESGVPSPVVTVTISYPAPAGMDGLQGARLVLAKMLGKRMMKIREVLGASYGIGAGRATRVGPGAWIVRGPIHADRAGEAIAAMRKEIDSLREPSLAFDETFVVARREVLKDLLSDTGTTPSLAGQLANMSRYNLSKDHYDKLVKFVGALSPAQVRLLMKTELRPETEVVGCFGPLDKCKTGYKEAGLKNAQYIE